MWSKIKMLFRSQEREVKVLKEIEGEFIQLNNHQMEIVMFHILKLIS